MTSDESRGRGRRGSFHVCGNFPQNAAANHEARRHSRVVGPGEGEVTRRGVLFGLARAVRAFEPRASPHRMVVGVRIAADSDEEPELAFVAHVDVQ